MHPQQSLYTRRWKAKKKAETGHTYQRDYMRVWFKGAYQKKKIEAFTLLGGKCFRCGFTDLRALQIDHVKGYDGGRVTKGRKWAGNRNFNGLTLYRQVVRTPEKFQLLCANCNAIKEYARRQEVGVNRQGV